MYVGVFGIKELANTLDGQALALVHHLAAAVVAFAGVALGVFIGHATAHGLHHLVADEILRSDKFYTAQLALVFGLDEVEDFCVLFHLYGGIVKLGIRN